MDENRSTVFKRKSPEEEITSYTPSSLRETPPKERKEMWGIGIRHAPREIGMTDGPFETEVEALETIGERKACIVHFCTDGTDEIVWYWRKNQWRKRNEKNTSQRRDNNPCV